MTTITRRTFALGTAGLLASASLAHAQGAGFGSTQIRASEWAEGFDSQSRMSQPVSTTTPILSPQTIPAMEQVIYAYQDLVARGGWSRVPADKALKLGMRDPNVRALRIRLIASGDLRQTTGDPEAFDSYVQAAVRRFQERHGIPADGVAGSGTINALNVPAEARLSQLQANVERIRAMGVPTERYVMVNIPGAQIEVVENGRVVSRHTAVVGKVDRQTPLLSSRITEINFNPFWTVPASIIRKDLIPKMQKEPDYLTNNKIRIYTQTGQELQPEQVNWHSDEATHYMFRQDPGDQNSLGSMKINFSNPFQVYLHDTPSKNLFGSDYRFESSGCVRVHNVRELVAWILRDNGYNLATVDQAVRSGERVDVKVQNPPLLFTVYFTAWTTGDGIVHFREDIYNLDAPNAVALNQNSDLIGSPLEALAQ
ncbi:L,D-transpeptidase family protein [Propylenella binzhouense]|uniref:Murein L,D-transpeptidase n=1 Tax=Propylenella binzhouense TaxID=2555902 RepID=A0A964WSD4_9HYPH|nr:L,D-transpeptidase family protein [Propylenella binzhouense]MYZ46700.1 murein L,D-transpeptidase [Propylenella binzhouense]